MTPKQSRPAGTGRLTTTTAILIVQATRACPLARAACLAEDPDVDAAVLRLHPPQKCPAMRERAA
jgi:hypothetical protein